MHKLNLQICYQIISKLFGGNSCRREVSRNFATDSPRARISLCKSIDNIYNRFRNNMEQKQQVGKVWFKSGVGNVRLIISSRKIVHAYSERNKYNSHTDSFGYLGKWVKEKVFSFLQF